MKAIVDGKRYDTEAAEELASWDSGHHAGDFNRVSEALYRTPKGAYFIAGEGGANTGYAEPCEGGNMRTSGEAIRVVSEREAVEWCERTHNFTAEDLWINAG